MQSSLGQRGAHRKQSAETIFKAALNKAEAALQLMVDLEIEPKIKDMEEMFKYCTVSGGLLKQSEMKVALADKLKSQG
jgi:hypothetical protein